MHKSYLEGTAGGLEPVSDGIGMSILAAIASTNDSVCSTLLAIVLIKSSDELELTSCLPFLLLLLGHLGSGGIGFRLKPFALSDLPFVRVFRPPPEKGILLVHLFQWPFPPFTFPATPLHYEKVVTWV